MNENKIVLTEEEEAIAELKAMSTEELHKVPYETVWWICCAKGCYGGTKVRDYGISPEYWKKQYGFFWMHERYILCSRHWPLYKRLIKNYSPEHIARRMMDFEKNFILTDQEKKELTKATKKPRRAPEMKRRK